MINGTLDGRTPPKYTKDIIDRFPNHNRIIVENAGHNDLLDNKIMTGIISFVMDSLTSNIIIHRDIKFSPPVPYKYPISDTIVERIKEKDVGEAIQLYRDLYKEYGQVEDYIFEFNANAMDVIYEQLAAEGDYKKAIEFLEFALTEFPESPIIYRDLGHAHYKDGNLSKARLHLEKALQLDFFDPSVQSLLETLNR